MLPSQKHVRMSVERRLRWLVSIKLRLIIFLLLSVGRTPMMDLLVQITSAHRINPGGHVIQVMNDRSDDFLYYKPSTPIGKNFWKGRMFGTCRISFCQFSLCSGILLKMILTCARQVKLNWIFLCLDLILRVIKYLLSKIRSFCIHFQTFSYQLRYKSKCDPDQYLFSMRNAKAKSENNHWFFNDQKVTHLNFDT